MSAARPFQELAAAADAAADAIAAAEKARLDPGMPVSAYPVPAGRCLVNPARWMMNILVSTGNITAGTLARTPGTGHGLREKLKTAARHCDAAADSGYDAVKAIERDLKTGGTVTARLWEDDRPPLVRIGNTFSRRVTELESSARQADGSQDPPLVSALDALADITAAEALIVVRMSRAARRFHGGLTSAYEQQGPHAARRAAPALGSLHQSGASLQRAATVINRVHAALAAARDQARAAESRRASA